MTAHAFPRAVAPPSAADTVAPHLTEAAAAERFVRLHGDDLRFIHAHQHWLVWTGHRWARDLDAEVLRAALRFVRDWQREAVDVLDRRDREVLLNFTLKLERRDALTSMLGFASTMKPIADAGQSWDVDPWLLGVPNGVVDLKTGHLRDGHRDDRITLNTAVAFDADAPCHRWEDFLAEIFDGADDMVTFVWRALGYSISGATSEQCLMMPFGSGSNGKSTLLQIVKGVLGDYAWCMPFATVELRQRAAIPNDVAALAGKRFVISSEANDGTRLNEARVKALTGSDTITARFLHGEFFEFDPVAKFWLGTNHKPTVKDDSHGFWRRIRLIPFDRQFAINPALADALRAETAGILAWLVRGCLAYQHEGLNPPAAVLAATQDYADENDPLAEFINESCEIVPTAEVTAAEFYQHYGAWADARGFSERERLNATAFGRKAAARFEKVRTASGGRYRGVARRCM